MQETQMDREIREQVERVRAGFRAKLARVEERKKEAKREARRIGRRLPRTFRGYLLWRLTLWAAGGSVRRLRSKRSSVEEKIRAAENRAIRERYEEYAAREREQGEYRRRIREATADLRRRYGGRPPMICGREPESWKELQLVEDFLSGAEKRHELCLKAWRRAGGDSRHQEWVRRRLERDLPLRRYESQRAAF